MEPCLCSGKTKGGAGEEGAAGGQHEGNLVATNTPRRENNVLIKAVGIKCTDRRMNARLFFLLKCNIMQLRVSFQFVIALAAEI